MSTRDTFITPPWHQPFTTTQNPARTSLDVETGQISAPSPSTAKRPGYFAGDVGSSGFKQNHIFVSDHGITSLGWFGIPYCGGPSCWGPAMLLTPGRSLRIPCQSLANRRPVAQATGLTRGRSSLPCQFRGVLSPFAPRNIKPVPSGVVPWQRQAVGAEAALGMCHMAGNRTLSGSMLGVPRFGNLLHLYH